eukprot:160852-Heterocapsa_arctica.AAC.1
MKELSPTALSQAPAAVDHICAVADDVEALSSMFRSPHCCVELRSGYSLPARRSAIGPLPLSFRPTPGKAPGCSV